MKRILPLLAAVVFCLAPNAARAQETVENELELVRKLRDKGWNDIAKQKVEELLKLNNATLNAALPLELARINITIARQLDPDQRFALFTQARALLQDFIKQNQGKAEAAVASVELARVTSYHAQAILSRAMREEETRVRHEKARPAEAMFIQAGKDLEAAIKAIDGALANPANDSVKSTLEREQRQARFDLAINLFDQAKTYIDRGKDKVNLDRSVTMTKAIKAFTELRSDESSEVGWLANAWLMKCSVEITAPDDVVKYHKLVMDRAKDPAAQPAVRLVRYFAMQDMTTPRPDEPETIGNNSLGSKSKKKQQPIDRIRGVQKEGEAWLKAYPNHHKSYEGQGVRYELGHAYMAEALMMEKDAKVVKNAFANASEHFKKLSEYDGELAERARQLNMSIRFKTVAEAKGQLKDFDDFVMKAMIERKAVIDLSRKMDSAPPAEQKTMEENRKKHLKEVIAALNRALAMADTKTPIQKVDDARYYLCGAYLAYGDPYRAAIVGEALGRGRTTRRSPEGASTAIATYSALQARHPEDASIRQRLFDMAEFVLSPQSQTTWKDDPVTSLAHYHLAMVANRDNKAKKAIEHLEKLSPDFVDYIYTQGQLVFIAQAAREKTEDPKEQKYFANAAKAALNRMPKYNEKDDSPTVITMYYFAKVELSKFQYAEAIEDLNAREELKAVKKLNEMAKYVRELQSQIGTLPGKTISAENRDQIEFSMQVMLKYADLGIAEVKFRSDAKDRFDQVIAATKSVVDDTLKKAKATPGPLAMKDYRVTGDILSLALRANVQKGNIEQGKALLDILNRLTGTKGEQSGNVVAVLLNDIAGQIKTMKESKDSALAKTRDSYTAFLDVIGKEYETKGADPNALILLAHAYTSLEYPAKAAAQFAKIKPPPGIEKEIPKRTGKETDAELAALAKAEEAANRYWGVQIEYIRALRASKDKEALKTAEAAAKKLIDNKGARYQLHAMMERNLIMEDLERYREAYIGWQAFLKNPSISGPNLSKPEVQKIFFPAYHHYVRSLYKLAVHDPKITDRKKFIDAAANMIVKLEFQKTREGWQIAGPMFEEILKDPQYDKLKKEYDRIKALQPKTSRLDANRPEFVLARLDAADRSGWPSWRLSRSAHRPLDSSSLRQ